MSAQPETWRVSTVEGVFETDLETLRQWILEGCVLPTDKVCKGNLSWIDAGRVPKLKSAFAGEVDTPSLAAVPSVEPSSEDSTRQQTASTSFTPPSNPTCHNHPDVAPLYICRVCNALLCKECPKFVGTAKVPLCSLCGDLCRPYEETRKKIEQRKFQSSGFGLADLGRALRYPFEHKDALIVGALVYGALLLAGSRGYITATVLLFCCASHVICQVAWGRLHRSFMPDFGGFDLMDDLIVPGLLGIAITIVSWGPAIALIIALAFGVVSSDAVTPAFSPSRTTAAQSQRVGPSAADLAVLTDPNADPEKLAKANAKLNETRPGVQISRQAEESRAGKDDLDELAGMVLPHLKAHFWFLVLLLVFLAWGVFYYPMALAVAGYTQSVSSVLNPLVGLDTIRRMRGTYLKAFGMVVVIQIVATIVGIIVGLITSPFSLPFVGNLPGNVVNGMFTFYFNLVIACVLGLSLFKCADRLGIDVD
jgi:hypothetical protein